MEMFKKITALTLTAILCLTFTVNVSASLITAFSFVTGVVTGIYGDVLYVESEDKAFIVHISEETYILGENIEVGDVITAHFRLVGGRTSFFPFEGEVLVMIPQEEPGRYIVYVRYEQRSPYPWFFYVDFNTTFLGEPFEIGDVITAFYPWRMGGIEYLYDRPQYPAILIASDSYNIFVGRTYGDNILHNMRTGMVVLDLCENIKRITLCGEPFTTELGDNSYIAAVYSYETIDHGYRVITPDKLIVLQAQFPRPNMDVVVLSEIKITSRLLTPEEFDMLGIHSPGHTQEPEVTQINEIEITHPRIVVNDIPLPDGNGHLVVGRILVPTHVPLRPVLEVLDTEVFWNAGTREVTLTNLHGQEVSFQIDSPIFRVGDKEVVLRHPNIRGEYALITPPQTAVINGNRTYVPFQFFEVIFGMRNAYLKGNTVYINNHER